MRTWLTLRNHVSPKNAKTGRNWAVLQDPPVMSAFCHRIHCFNDPKSKDDKAYCRSATNSIAPCSGGYTEGALKASSTDNYEHFKHMVGLLTDTGKPCGVSGSVRNNHLLHDKYFRLCGSWGIKSKKETDPLDD